jgi:esterase
MQLHFHVDGNGQPLIILHGLLGSLDNWRTVSQRLASLFTVFAVDLRNHGGSSHSDVMSYEIMSQDLSRFMLDQQLSSAFVLGHSLGGKVAMQFAIDYPDSVAKLIVVDVAPRAYEPAHRSMLNALLSLDLKSYKSFAEVEHALAVTIPNVETRQLALKNLTRESDRKFRWKIDLNSIARNYDTLTMAISSGTYDKPTLFIRGGDSNYILDNDLPRVRSMFPQAQIMTIAGAGHWVHVDAREEFLRAVIDFLGPHLLDS